MQNESLVLCSTIGSTMHCLCNIKLMHCSRNNELLMLHESCNHRCIIYSLLWTKRSLNYQCIFCSRHFPYLCKVALIIHFFSALQQDAQLPHLNLPPMTLRSVSLHPSIMQLLLLLPVLWHLPKPHFANAVVNCTRLINLHSLMCLTTLVRQSLTGFPRLSPTLIRSSNIISLS